MGSGLVNKVIAGLLAMIVVFEILAGFRATLSTSATCIAAQSATYGSLVSLFGPAGILFLIMIIGVFYTLYKMFWSGK